MELFAFLKAMALLAFIALGGLKMLQWALVAVAVVGGVIALRRRRRSPVALGVGLILLAAALWLAMIPLPGRQDFFGEPGQYATMRQRSQAQEACEAEYPGLPDRYPVASLVDEANGLEEQSVMLLLTQRQLDFVEIRLSGNAGGAKVGTYKSFSSQLPRPAEAADARYARLSLAPAGTAGCLAEKAMPERLRDYLKVWPLPADRCLRLQHSTQASAAFSLAYVLEPQPERPIWGHYRITEIASGSVIAQLTSADGYEGPTHGRISTLDTGFQRPECHTPHTALADRLVGTRGVAPVQASVVR